MPTFLAERYWPGVTPDAARAVAAAVTDATRGSRKRGVRVLETIVADADEVCFWYVEAGAVGDVIEAFAAAEVVLHRVAPARSVAPGR